MSSTEVLSVRPGASYAPATVLVRLRNSWWSIYPAWKAIAKNYAGADDPLQDGVLQRVFDTPAVPRAVRALLAISWDLAYIEAAHAGYAARDIFECIEALSIRSRAPHLVWVANFLCGVAATDIQAIGFCWTTVARNLWEAPDDQTGDPVPFDWSMATSVYRRPGLLPPETRLVGRSARDM